MKKLYVKTRNYLCKEEEGMLLLIMPGYYKRLTLTENKIKLLETYLTVIKNNPDEIVNMYFPSSVFSCTASIQEYSPFIIIPSIH